MTNDSIKKEYRYRLELHCHSSGASHCSEISPEDVVDNYKAEGVDGIVLTNHFLPSMQYAQDKDEKLRIYREDYEKAFLRGKEVGVTVIFGMELRFSESTSDYLFYGVNPSELEAILSLLDKGIDNFYRVYKNDKNILFQAHPFRDGSKCADAHSLDGIEAYNMHPNHNSRIGLCLRHARDNSLKTIAGSDYHHPDTQALGLVRFKTLPRDSFELAKLLSEGDYVFDLCGSIVLPQ